MGRETEITTIPRLRRVFSDTIANLNLLVGLMDGDLGYSTDLTQLFRQNGAGAANWVAVTSGLIGQGVRVFDTGQTIAHNTETALDFTNESWDTDACHEGIINPSRLTCNTAGVYVIHGWVRWVSNNVGRRWVGIRYNGGAYASVVENDPCSTHATQEDVSAIYTLAITDYVELCVVQHSGGNLDVQTPAFSMQRVSN